MIKISGLCSTFGGPDDLGMSESEGLAFVYEIMDAPHLFLPYQPEGTTGLARRLNPHVHYIAARFDYSQISKEELLVATATLYNPRTKILMEGCFCADWGPGEQTGRALDLSPSLARDLGLTTDDFVEAEIYKQGEEEELIA
jgi:hypothetical protein